MKALDEYFLMVVYPLLLNRVDVFANLYFIPTEKDGSEWVKSVNRQIGRQTDRQTDRKKKERKKERKTKTNKKQTNRKQKKEN